MYARYIPPARPKPDTRQETSQDQADAVNGGIRATVSAPPPPVPRDSFSYARYVPTAKPTVRATAAETQGSPPRETSGEQKKRKRDGLEDGAPEGKKRAITVDDGKRAEEGLSSVDTQAGVTETESEKKSKKEKKEKKKKSKKDPEEEKADDEDATNTTGQPAPTKATEIDDKEERKRRKEEKRRRKDEKRQREVDGISTDDAPTAPAEADSDVEMTGTAGASPSKESKKGRKEKKEKRKKRKEAADEESSKPIGDEVVARHHKAVLDRKEKALRNVHLLAPQPSTSEEGQPEASKDEADAGETYGLEPLPQPEPVDFSAVEPAFDALPSWISDPVRVEEGTRVPFTDLNIPEKVARALGAKGYKDAFAVQTAAIPLLLPTAKHFQGDVLVSAATGSGKTLAYAIPIVRDISQGAVTRLRALVVLPTRELVKQAKEAFEICAGAFDGQGRKRVKIGIAYGSQSLKAEQTTLIDREERYDPEAFASAEKAEAEREALAAGDDSAALGQGPVKGALPDHIVDFNLTVDILICTPGRLVDHINQTQGFSLEYVRWLVVDEGDKLLEQNYQNWIPTVMGALQRADDPAAPDGSKILGARDFPGSSLSGVRKVFLSATLTSTGSLAAVRELGLRRPRLVMLGGGGRRDGAAEHVLPESLREGTVRVRDENLKPLYLHELLMSKFMRIVTAEDTGTSKPDVSDSESSDSETETEAKAQKPAFQSTALIFTKSNESALRLTRLLTLLDPSLAPLLGTLTSATPHNLRRRTISLFTSGRLRVLVASDLVARGIDLPSLDHVVNYDLPPSLEAYVHRVGRTARAGRQGWAWTLVPDGKEGGWFWGEVVRGTKVTRTHAVERVRVGDGEDGEVGEDKIEVYEAALAELAKEASEARKKG